jgi:hypothetical protein
MAKSIRSLRLSTNKDIADSLANLDLGGLAEGVPDEVVVVPLTELDILLVIARLGSELDRTGCYRCASVHRQKLVKSSTHPPNNIIFRATRDDIGKRSRDPGSTSTWPWVVIWGPSRERDNTIYRSTKFRSGRVTTFVPCFPVDQALAREDRSKGGNSVPSAGWGVFLLLGCCISLQKAWAVNQPALISKGLTRTYR